MYQSTTQQTIRASISRRIDGMKRNLEGEITAQDLVSMRTQVVHIHEHILTLRSALSQENWLLLAEKVDSLVASINDRASAGDLLPQTQLQNPPRPQDPTMHDTTRKRGRPKITINKEKLEELLDLDFTVTDIAKNNLLGYPIHRNTLHNFMQKEGKC